MAAWMPVDRKAVNTPKEQDDRGVKIQVFMSPHDIPSDVRGEFDSTIDKFVIEFRYFDDEPLREQLHDQYLSLALGKHSGRLFKIIIDVRALKASQVELELMIPKISEALQGLASREYSRRNNYEVANRVISGRQQELLKEVSSSA